MPETPIHIYTPDGRNLTETLGEMYPGNVGDVLRRQADGTYAAQAVPSGGGGGTAAPTFREKLTVTATNALSQTSYVMKPGTVVVLYVRGADHSSLSGDFSFNGKDITITPGGYVILVGWQVEVEYITDETITPPQITNFNPTSASNGSQVVITGSAFNNVQSVVMGGVVQTNYVVNSLTQITVTLVAGSYTNNNVTVTTASGSATVSGFTYLDPTPTITNLAPIISAIGNSVVITGTNFTSVSAVRFGGVNAASFVVNSTTQITAVVADTGASGTVQVTTPFGTATSVQSITLDQILDFPRSGRVMSADNTVIAGLTYIASATSVGAVGREAHKAFTLLATDYWLATSNLNQSLTIQLPLRARVRRYVIKTANIVSGHPQTWQFQGSLDGTSWTTLHSQSGQSLVSNAEYHYNFTNNVFYNYYRLVVQSSASGNIAVGRLWLFSS